MTMHRYISLAIDAVTSAAFVAKSMPLHMIDSGGEIKKPNRKKVTRLLDFVLRTSVTTLSKFDTSFHY